MKRLPDRDWFTANAVKAILEISEGTLYEMIRTGEIWEPSLDERGRNVWSFDAVADACERQIDRWLDEDVFRSLREHASRRRRHTRDELDDLREWIKKQRLKRRSFQSPEEAAEWDHTHREAGRRSDNLQSMEVRNQRQRIGTYFGWIREEGKRATRLVGLVPFGPPAPRRDKD